MTRGGWGLAILAAAVPILALAQGTQVPFGGLHHDASQPVEITADRLDVDQAAGSAVFTGTVKVGQGTLRLAADRVDVFYDQTPSAPAGKDKPATQATGTPESNEKPAAPAGPATGRIKRLIATGNVALSNGSEAAEAKHAVYEVAAGTIAMDGDVLLTQGQNALSGATLLIDLNKGTGQIEGRVKTVFVPSTTPAPGAAAPAKPAVRP
ncbi:MAG: LptA/OstA family protein [Amaricoccus sp.]